MSIFSPGYAKLISKLAKAAENIVSEPLDYSSLTFEVLCQIMHEHEEGTEEFESAYREKAKRNF